jgi:hypothetical protein
MKRYLLPMVFMFALGGCDQAARFDASSQEAFSYSGEKIIDALPKEKKEELLRAGVEIERYADVATGGRDKVAASRMYMTIFDGKTVDEVIKESKELRIKTEEKLQQKMSSN